LDIPDVLAVDEFDGAGIIAASKAAARQEVLFTEGFENRVLICADW
jgi:hypothetical protein